MRSLGRETLAQVWTQVDVARDTRGIQVEAFCSFMRLLESARALPEPSAPAEPAEYFRLSAIISAGGLVVSEPSNPIDEAALKDIVVFESDIYNKAGGWSAATTELLADAARLRAWRDRALAAYRSRFDPVALLRRADAWNERARGDL